MSHHHLRPLNIIATGLALVVTHAAFAQAPPPPPAPPAAPGALGAPPPPPGVGDIGTSTVAGRVSQMLINSNGDVDGFLLEDGTQVQFPPHLSATFVQSVGVGADVSVQGIRAYNVPVFHASLITNRATNASIVDQPPDPSIPPPSPRPLTALQASGSVSKLLYTDRGDLNGVLLADSTIVHFPPHIGMQMQTSLRTGDSLSASGYGTQNRFGRSLEATTLTVNGQSPIAVYAPPPPAR